VSTSAFVLVDASLPIGNHTISEYLRLSGLSFIYLQTTRGDHAQRKAARQ